MFAHPLSGSTHVDRNRRRSAKKQLFIWLLLVVSLFLLAIFGLSFWMSDARSEGVFSSNGKSDERVFIFGYGSLLNKDSAERTLGSHMLLFETANAKRLEMVAARMRGVERQWACDLQKYYGIHGTASAMRYSANGDAFVNGIVFELDPLALKDLDTRERPYDRREVHANELLVAVNNNGVVDSSQFQYERFEPLSNGKAHVKVYTYIIKPEVYETAVTTPKSQRPPVSMCYVDICLSGALRIGGVAFAKEWIETTADWNTVPLRNDRDTCQSDLLGTEHALVSDKEIATIDSLFNEFGIAVSNA